MYLYHLVDRHMVLHAFYYLQILFLESNFFNIKEKKIFQEYHHRVKQFWPR